MDKNSAINIIENTFNAKFDESRFTLFIKNLLNDVEPKSNAYSGNYIWDDYKEHINTYKRLGKYTDPEGEALDILMVEVKSVSKLERARTTLRNFVIKHLSKFEKDFALVAFYSKEDGGADWRFSFIKLEHQSYLDEEKQKVKTRKEYTPAKRYSFLVGEYEKAYTAKKQLLPLLQNVSTNPTVEEIEDAFSIEKVTDEFFTQYKDLYVKLYEHFDNDNHVKAALEKANIDNTRFTKKLLGQIVFLYFLQKKGWMGVPKTEHWGKGKKRFIQELFDKSKDENRNFFKDYLQYLFYEALAKERSNENSFYGRFNCRIPFLNGGLFEAEYDWKNANISIPENLFRNTEKNKAGDIGTGVLDVFDRYNFTIKEDEPLDKEVAVDPEMLGKVFENMLDIVERKSKGAYYTPREIVHYMCQESLIHYLDNSLNDNTTSYQEIDSDQLAFLGGSTDKKGQTKIELEHKGKVLVPKTDIETYIRNGHFALEHDQRVANKGKETKDYKYIIPESIRQNADLIDKKLTEIRICDPAIGSGAFPVGLLHELVNAQLVIKPHLSKEYFSDKLKDNGIDSKNSNSESRYVYRIKRHIIQESIYGVDIDASAIDIARLRLWLSLVVDEDDLDPIETLPNLDYKIVCGNSLIGLPAQGADRYPQLKDELEILKKDFYSETDETLKKRLKKQIDVKINTVLETAENFEGYKIDFDFKLFFSEVWRGRDGFDIVIGNPPYVQLQDKSKISSELLEIYQKQNFKTFIRSGDIYSLFYEKGLSLTRSHKGLLSFITSNRFCFTNYGESTRKYLTNKSLKTIINLNKIPVFKEANVGTIITIVANENKQQKLIQAGEFKTYNFNKSFTEQLFEYTDFVSSSYYDNTQWSFYDESIMRLRKRIVERGVPLNRLNNLSINRGLTTGLNKVFIIPINEAKSIFKEKKSYEVLKLVFKGAEIKRWRCKRPNNYIFYTYTGIDIEKYPEVLSYLEKYKESLEKVYEARKGQKKWYELRKCSYYESFSKPKIIWTRLSNINSFAISEGGEFSIDSTSFAVGNHLKYYCTILNSSVVFFYFKLGGVIWGKDGIKWFGDYFDKIPVLKPTHDNQNCFNTTYDYLNILAENNTKNIELSYFEAIVDGAIFELYFPEELKSANKEILKHLGDLKPITDKMSEEEKLAIIQSEFERLYDPNHPVRNNLETLDSIEEVRIIKEALK